MASITLKGNPIETSGNLPATGTAAPAFTLTGTDLSDRSLHDFKGQKVLLNIFPSLDTSVCATSVRRFNQEAAGVPGAAVLCISRDLPFAHQRFCSTEGIDKVVNLSEMKDNQFGQDYGVRIQTGPLAGVLARAVVVLDEEGKVVYQELVPEITQEPDYDAALHALNA